MPDRSGPGPGPARGSGEKRSSEPPRYLAVGRILRPWGVRGVVKVETLSDFPERFLPGAEFLLGDARTPLRLEESRQHQGGWLLKFAGYDTPEAWAQLRGQFLYIPAGQAMPLEEDEYFIHQIVGLEVWTDQGERLGEVREVLETGANDVYLVDRDGETILLPAISQVILEIDLERGRMHVHLMEGLIP